MACHNNATSTCTSKTHKKPLNTAITFSRVQLQIRPALHNYVMNKLTYFFMPVTKMFQA